MSTTAVSRSDDAVTLATNRELWTTVNRAFTDADSRRAWATTEITWGLFHAPERDLGVLGDVRGLDVVELGCGTAYFSARLARHGARVVAVDATHAQLTSAARCQQLFGPEFPLVEADAETVPLADESFDLAVSEYGASAWCDPERWIAEAARLLRPGGRLVFLTNSVLVTLCVPEDEGFATEQLQRPQRGLGRVAGRVAAPSSTPAMGIGSGSSRPTGSRSSRCTSCTRPRALRRPTTTRSPRPNGRRGGRSRTSGRPAWPDRRCGRVPPCCLRGSSTTDYHTAGEPFRIVADPPVPIPGATVAERRARAIEDPDVQELRAVLCSRAARARRHVRRASSCRPTTRAPTSASCSGTRTASRPPAGTARSRSGCGRWRPAGWRRPATGSVDVVVDVPSGRVDGAGAPRATAGWWPSTSSTSRAGWSRATCR